MRGGRSEDDMASVQIEDFDDMASDESGETSIKRMEGSFSNLNSDERRKSRGSVSISRQQSQHGRRSRKIYSSKKSFASEAGQ